MGSARRVCNRVRCSAFARAVRGLLVAQLAFSPGLASAIDTDGDGLSDAEEIAGGSFGPERVISTLADVARSVVAADVDGDGDPDVISASSNDNEVAWYENTDGIGGFGPQRHISWIAEPPVFVADMDGDGDPDALSRLGAGPGFAWYENVDGAGSFGPKPAFGTEALNPSGVIAADVDGDGDLDAVSTGELPPAETEFFWLENTDGAGSFGPLQVVTTTYGDVTAISAADVDGDGDTDLISGGVNITLSVIAWYENTDGAGSFGPQQVISNLALSPQSVIAADVDGDGDQDVLSASRNDDKIAWYENTDGAGSFGPQQVITTLATDAREVFAADVDGDGDTDVLSASSFDDTIAWYENTDGSGTFGPQLVISNLADGAWSVFATDVDGDGDLDVLSAWGADTIAWHQQLNPSDPFDFDTDDDGVLDGAEVNTYGTEPTRPDTDGDGLGDGEEVSIYGTDPLARDTDGDGLLDGAEVATHPTSPLVADSDSDGMGDGFELAWGFDPADFDENSNGTLDGQDDFDGDGLSNATEESAGTDPNEAGDPPPLDPADLDRDGLEDVWELANGLDASDPDENSNGIVDGQDDFDADGLGNAAERTTGTDPNDADSDDDTLLDGEEVGTGNFGPQQVINTLADGANWVSAADLNGDGHTDVLAAADTALSWHENLDGAGSFGPQQAIDSGWADTVVAADLDGDGDNDVVSARGISKRLTWHENTDGMGSFGPEQVIAISSQSSTSAIAADLNRDGSPDLITTALEAGADDISWQEATGGPWGFGAPRSISTLEDGPRSVFAADVDGDGDLDVLSAASNDDTIAWHENTSGTGDFGARHVISTLADSAWSVFAADVDGDGDIDALSASRFDDTIAWYENTDGAGAFGPQQVISSLADSPYAVFAADVDGDGDIDALSASANDDKIAWYENMDGLGSFAPQQVISTLADFAVSVFATDVDGDGDLDVLSASAGDDKIAWYEQRSVADPLDADSDDDGLPDAVEVNILGTDALDPDTDDDGLLDPVETNTGTYVSPSDTGTDPLDPDTDDDKLLDGVETNTGTYVSPSDTGTDPFDPDTDGDGVEDGSEVLLGFDPLDDMSTPPLPLPECMDGIDNDGDLLVDFGEDPGCDAYPDPVEGDDMDGDGTIDVLDFCKLEPDAPSLYGCDTDNDGIGNYCDCDLNHDGVCASVDSGIFLGDLGTGIDSGSGTDMNCDGIVNALDTARFISGLLMGVPGPSGLPCAGTVPCP
jgi:hypothetical protein